MSEFPELDKMEQDMQVGKPGVNSTPPLMMLSLGLLLIAMMFLAVVLFFKALGGLFDGWQF